MITQETAGLLRLPRRDDDEQAEATRCSSCDVVLNDDNAAVTCTEHPSCLTCEDPHAICGDCSLERARITTDRAEDHHADQARDTREDTR